MHDPTIINPPPKAPTMREEPYHVERGERLYMALSENPNGTCDVVATSDRKTEDVGYRSFNLARCRNRKIAEVVMAALAEPRADEARGTGA
jgi:hypothetical protein